MVTRGKMEHEVGTEHEKEEGWNVVRRKKVKVKQKNAEVAKNHVYFPKDSRRTTYFFTNFPENFHAKHMLKAFLHYGDFEEVVIPAKRDKIGRRFGFARAVNVQDPEKFAVKLDNIIIGSEKIMVNLPRFQRKPLLKSTIVKPPQSSYNLNSVIVTPNHHDKQIFHSPREPSGEAKPLNPKTPGSSIPIPYPNPIPNLKHKPKPALPNHPTSIVHHNQNLNFIPPKKPRRRFLVSEEEMRNLSTAYAGIVECQHPGIGV